MLKVEGLGLAYGERELFRDINLAIGPGESVAIMGKSGVGKTSLLNLILGLQKPTSGRIEVRGQSLTGMNAELRAKVRRESLGAVFQSGELMPQLTAVENVALPMMLMKRGARESFAVARQVLGSLEVESLNIASNRLSGGERQRVALARAVVHEPAVVVADEPTGSLDVGTREVVAQLLFETVKSRGSALLVVTHDDEIASMADRKATLTHSGLEWDRAQSN